MKRRREKNIGLRTKFILRKIKFYSPFFIDIVYHTEELFRGKICHKKILKIKKEEGLGEKRDKIPWKSHRFEL